MLSILIVNWNTKDCLRACLASLRAHPSQGETEVIVVDNHSTDGSADMVAAEFPEVILIRSNSNLGYAAGNNLAIASAKGDFLLTLNPDTEVLPNTLDATLAEFSRPEVGVVACKLVGPDGQAQASVRGFPTLAGILGDVIGASKWWPNSALGSYRLRNFDYARSQIAPQPMGTYLLFKRSALEQVSEMPKAFDEQFPIFFNEVDLLYRLKLAGQNCWYTAETKVRHLGGMSTKQVRKSMIWESHQSLVRYLAKHRIGSSIFRALVCQLILIGAWVRAKGKYEGFRA
ncbi:MAG: glycosyltransferase family 2 protein [Armatimonadetes bacterium]|nr:glycosyltransferase family 2 protein [Armatimonadota bacterium]